MKFTTKIPVYLGLVGSIMLTSCSKEDMQLAPEQSVVNAKESANVKENMVAWVSGTKGYPGYNILPAFWERYNATSGSSSPEAYPAGTSNPIYLWGNLSSPLKQNLQTIPGQPWSSFITMTSSSKTDLKKKSLVQTKLRFLTPGKTYSLTVYVATAVPKWKGLGAIPTYAERCELWISAPSFGIKTYPVDFTEKQNVWVKKIITFEAKTPEMTLTANAWPKKEGDFAWAHIFVGQEALVQMN